MVWTSLYNTNVNTPQFLRYPGFLRMFFFTAEHVKFRPSAVATVFWRQQIYSLMCTNASEPTEEDKEREIERIKQTASLDDPPTACCRSGCANCVFIVWAEAITSKMENAGPEVTDKIMQMVDDPSMKAYLEMELRIRGMKK